MNFTISIESVVLNPHRAHINVECIWKLKWSTENTSHDYIFEPKSSLSLFVINRCFSIPFSFYRPPLAELTGNKTISCEITSAQTSTVFSTLQCTEPLHLLTHTWKPELFFVHSLVQKLHQKCSICGTVCACTLKLSVEPFLRSELGARNRFHSNSK